MFGSRRLGPETVALDQNVVLLFFEYLIGSPDERGKWTIMGKEAEPLEGWIRLGWKVIGQSQSSVTNLGGMQAVMLTYTLSRMDAA
jgi:hypothetical protein